MVDSLTTRISTPAEYEAAVAEIARLWDAPPGSPAAARLDRLALSVRAYEQQHRAPAQQAVSVGARGRGLRQRARL